MAAEKPEAVRVLYCPICSLPAEYCEFGPDFEKCKPWLVQNAPDLYPHLLLNKDEAAAGGEKDASLKATSDQLQSLEISSGDGGGGRGGTSTSKHDEVKRLPGGKIKKKDKQEVVIEKVVRNKRKCVTIIKGLDLFGVKLSEASKKLGKKFATGASVVKGPTEKEQIDVQGDIAYDIVEFITETWLDVVGKICDILLFQNSRFLRLQYILLKRAERFLLLKWMKHYLVSTCLKAITEIFNSLFPFDDA
ncbi:translation machinery-associated protein 22 isoform X2 [Amborella trichopoda]|uniref:translation machinery-associated protein 22 isoform X2 n=1 Tax=Amborella trichopoda TaxID=13333 RepID=UPI0005D40887|nr:translation machinery-associated protein 22 isoform X2 [Amborella trichopoda]|eukprot:XP_011625667.1 translation machinery-associated protein 22 isoform X2 [Amborella trichopoda]